MKIVGVYNIKGGVGKTATAVNLGYLASRQGLRTLIWDLDPQGAASFYFRIKPKVKGGGKGLIKGKRELDELVKGTDFEDLDLLPADFSYRHMDLALEDSKRPTKQLLRLLRPLSEEYDLVLLDCPPSISLVSENIFRAADLLLVPTIPTTLSARTLQQLHQFISANHKQFTARVLPFFSMADQRKRMHQELMAQLPKRYPDMLQSIIPQASDVERMGSERAPVGRYAGSGKAAKAYRALWEELRAML